MRPSTPKELSHSQLPQNSIYKFSTPTKASSAKKPDSSRKSLTFLSTSPGFHKKLASLSKTNSKSPVKSSQIDFKAVVQRNPEIFLREDVGKALDETLSRVFSAISKKKCEKEDLDIKQEIFMKEIKELEKEFPLISLRRREFLQEIAHENANIQQIQETVEVLRSKFVKRQAELQEKARKTQEKLQALDAKVKDLSQENSEIREKIAEQRGFMKRKIEEMRAEAQELRVSLKKAENLEEESRKKYENVKAQDSQRVEKLHHKEKAFFALIKH